MKLPMELQSSYLESRTYPKNLIPSGTATYPTKLTAYQKRLEDTEPDLCLVDGADEVDKIFEIPIVDMDTGDGRCKTLSA